MNIDLLTKQAIKHSLHCLIGCAIGETVGMVIASLLSWHRLGRVSLAIILAFFFGYLFTYIGIRKNMKSRSEAIKATLVTDTASLTTMELVDNFIEFLIPKALVVTISMARFWWGLALSLAIAFIITVPVNRYMISRTPMHQH